MHFGRKERSPGPVKLSDSGVTQALADMARVVAEAGDDQELPAMHAQVE
jgi:hypothetical protein